MQREIVSQVAHESPPHLENVQGVVLLEVTIGMDGSVQNLRAISGHPLLMQAAMDAVSQWLYKPYLLNGLPVSVIATVAVEFPAIAVSTVASGAYSGIAERRDVVVRAGADWTAFWTMHADGTPAAVISFSSEMVAGVFLGTRPTGGYSVEITGARPDGNALVIEYVERAPPETLS